MKENAIQSLLILSFRLKYQNCFNLLQSIYFPLLELFLFLFLDFCSVTALHCLFKVKRSESDTTLTCVWLMQSISKEIASQALCVLPALAHKQWAIVVINYIYILKKEKKKEEGDPSYSKNDCSRKKKKCLRWPHPVWLLAIGRKICSLWGLRSVCIHLCWGTLLLWIIGFDPALEKNRIYIPLDTKEKWTIKCAMGAL